MAHRLIRCLNEWAGKEVDSYIHLTINLEGRPNHFEVEGREL